MNTHAIIYDTCREVFNVEDKIRISSIFIFCYKLGAREFSEILYTPEPKNYIAELQERYKEYDIDLTVNFDNPNAKNAFFKTSEALAKKMDTDGFYKAIYNKDELALAVVEIIDRMPDFYFK